MSLCHRHVSDFFTFSSIKISETSTSFTSNHLTFCFATCEIMADENTQQKKEDSKKRPKRHPNKNYALKKRLPLKPVDGDNVIFITKKTNFKAQLDKCCDLLTRGEKEIILHGLGAAIQRCCNLALQLEILFSGTCQIEVNTGTVDCVDDLEPLTEELDFDSQVRCSSSIHIRIFRNAMLGANQ